MTIEAVDNFFDYLEAKLLELDITPDRFWNFDETGFQFGSPDGEWVVFNKRVSLPKSVSASSSSWVSIIEIISASGRILTPMLIHIGKEPKRSWWGPDDTILDWL